MTADDRAHRRRRMTGRDPHEEHRSATPLELLYDLTFVVAFGIAADELAHYLADGHFLSGVVGFCFATFAVAWAWINYSWFASAYDTDDWVIRLATMVQMLGVIVLALGLEQAFASIDEGDVARQRRDGRGLRRHARADDLPLAAQAARHDPPRRPAALRVRLDDLGRAGLLGRARDRRPPDRDDVRRSPRSSSASR